MTGRVVVGRGYAPVEEVREGSAHVGGSMRAKTPMMQGHVRALVLVLCAVDNLGNAENRHGETHLSRIRIKIWVSFVLWQARGFSVSAYKNHSHIEDR